MRGDGTLNGVNLVNGVGGGSAALGLLSSPLATLRYLTGSFVDTRCWQCPGSTLAFPFTYVLSLNDLMGFRAHCHC